jgi:hypothetical protein
MMMDRQNLARIGAQSLKGVDDLARAPREFAGERCGQRVEKAQRGDAPGVLAAAPIRF